MQNKDFSQNANLTKDTYTIGVTIIGTYAQFQEHVAGSAVLHGDHVRPNAWNYGYYRISYPQGSAVMQQGNYGGSTSNEIDRATFSGPLQGIGIFSFAGADLNPMRNAAYNQALSRLNEKIRGSLDLSVALGEASETTRMIKSLAKWERWFKGFGPKRWANEWLEYTYGWKPLLSDIYTAAGELKRKRDSMLSFVASASVEKQAPSGRDFGHPDVSGIGADGYVIQEGPSVKSVLKGKAKVSCKIGVTLAPPNDVQAAARWTSLNPLSIAWELMPYSFVIDWFVDIGSFLRDAETALVMGPRFVSGYTSKLEHQDYAESVNYNTRGVHHYFSGVIIVNSSSTVKVGSFYRTVLDSYPLPRLPQFNSNLSWRRLMSAAALLTQQLKR